MDLFGDFITLFIQNKIKNSSMQYHIALQGILMASHKKAVFYSSISSKYDNAEAQRLCEHVQNDFYTFSQNIFGVMKSIQSKEDLPFDVLSFIDAATKKSVSSDSQ